jgi:N-acetylmuramic acid 6-phosphate etherase
VSDVDSGSPQSPTELRNPATTDIDCLPVDQAIALIIGEDARAVEAARAATAQIVEAVEAAVRCLQGGGVIHYFGAGASGRLAVLDATEMTPTFGSEHGTFTAHFPGGLDALVDSSRDFEDSVSMGDADAAGLRGVDLAVGITASGSTGYVHGALERASLNAAGTVLLTCNPHSPLLHLAEIGIVVDTGPEVLTGSTRLKAGTATKVALNAFSTSLMIQMGHTYSNLMVGLVATNGKLRDRAVRILIEATGRPEADCQAVLDECRGRLPVALVRLLTRTTSAAAEKALEQHGSVRRAVDSLTGHV